MRMEIPLRQRSREIFGGKNSTYRFSLAIFFLDNSRERRKQHDNFAVISKSPSVDSSGTQQWKKRRKKKKFYSRIEVGHVLGMKKKDGKIFVMNFYADSDLSHANLFHVSDDCSRRAHTREVDGSKNLTFHNFLCPPIFHSNLSIFTVLLNWAWARAAVRRARMFHNLTMIVARSTILIMTNRRHSQELDDDDDEKWQMIRVSKIWANCRVVKMQIWNFSFRSLVRAKTVGRVRSAIMSGPFCFSLEWADTGSIYLNIEN